MSKLINEREGPVARLVLNRPDAGNALDLELAAQLAQAAAEYADDPSVRCVVLTGSGRMFCSGGDIGLFASGDSSAVLRELAGKFHEAITTLATMAKPLLVLVNGPAAGAGLSLALIGDIVIAARSAHFTAAYTGIGLTPDGGMTWTLQRLVGLRLAQEMILTNRRLGAAEALAAGLVSQVVGKEALVETGASTAISLASGPVAALGAARALLLAGANSTLLQQLHREAEAISVAGAGDECREGLAAFLEKRKPDFPGT